MILRESFRTETTQASRQPWRNTLVTGGLAGAPRFVSGVETLRGLDLFSPVSDGELVKFAALGCERRVEKGVAFRPGSGTESLLALILEGEALLAWDGEEGQLLHVLEPGDLLGETAVFDEVPAQSRARAVTTLRLIEWERDHVLEALRRWPDVALSLLCGMARRQRELHRRLAGICRQRAPRRLARALAALVEDRGVRQRDATGRIHLVVRGLPSRTRLGETSAMARETVSRLLTHWEARGWISTREGDLWVFDERQLRRLCGENLLRPAQGAEA